MEPVEPRDLRISDADRHRVAEHLREAAGEGRLDLEELDQRLEATYAARTYADLVPLTEDLPGHRDPTPFVPRPASPGPRPHAGPLRHPGPPPAWPPSTPSLADLVSSLAAGPRSAPPPPWLVPGRRPAHAPPPGAAWPGRAPFRRRHPLLALLADLLHGRAQRRPGGPGARGGYDD